MWMYPMFRRGWRRHAKNLSKGMRIIPSAYLKRADLTICRGLLAEKSSDSLFALDTTGSQDIQKAYNKNHKPLKADQILAQRSAVPSIDTHKRSLGTTDGVIEPSTKRRKTDGVNPREYERLRQVAYGKQSVQDIIKEDDDVPRQDPWAVDLESEKQDPSFDYLEKPKPIRAPSSLKEAPVSLLASAREVPAISKPKAGTSYNPVFQEWDALLTSEGIKEVEAEKKRLAQAQAEKVLAERIAALEKEAELEAAPPDGG